MILIILKNKNIFPYYVANVIEIFTYNKKNQQRFDVYIEYYLNNTGSEY